MRGRDTNLNRKGILMARRAQKRLEDDAAQPTTEAPAENQAGANEPADPFSGVDIGGTEPDGGTPGSVVLLEQSRERASGQPREAGPGRGWTERYEQPVAYRRFTLRDQHGAEKILFTFSLPKGQSKPDEEVIDVMRDHKFWKGGKPNGLAEDARTDGESYPTGLQFGGNAKFPKAWVLPNNALGREVADSIDRALQEVASKLQGVEAAVVS
jgi:hypothetical protein